MVVKVPLYGSFDIFGVFLDFFFPLTSLNLD